jgi:hypothetical protein
VLDPIGTVIDARRWTATVTSANPADIVALVAGDTFRSRFEEKFRLGFLIGRVTMPTIDASFLGPIASKASSVASRVRDGALLLGLNYRDQHQQFTGDPEELRDFAINYDVAGVVHPDAVDVFLEQVKTDIADGVAEEDATLDSLTIAPRNGYFRVAGKASKSTGSVTFAFRVVPSMFHTRPGASFRYEFKGVRIRSQTWPALSFGVEDLETDVDRAWWVVLFGEVILGIITLGVSIAIIEGMVDSTEANFAAKVRAARSSNALPRIRRTEPPPGGVAVRIGLEAFDITQSQLFIGISVRSTPTQSRLLGPAVVPATYRNDTVRYVLRLPSGASESDPALRVRWTLEDLNNAVVVRDDDGGAAGRLRFDFTPSPFLGSDFRIACRLYRQFGPLVSDLATPSVNLHVRSALAPGGYVRWRWKAETPQMVVNEETDAWSYLGKRMTFRYSEWHRTDEPCQAVNANSRYRYEVESADRLPFSLRYLENHRKGLCPYCFFGGPAGLNARL